jgi:hypothetical protein
MNDEFNKVFDIMQGLSHCCGGLGGDLTDKAINHFIGDGNACVLIISDGGTARPAEGIYNAGSSFGWDGEGHWSNTDSISDCLSIGLSHNETVRLDIQSTVVVDQMSRYLAVDLRSTKSSYLG